MIIIMVMMFVIAITIAIPLSLAPFPSRPELPGVSSHFFILCFRLVFSIYAFTIEKHV